MLPFDGLRRQDLHKANVSNVIRQGLRVDLDNLNTLIGGWR